MIQMPSQYQCDNMKQGDIIFVKHRNFLYKWFRKHFKKDKIIIRVRRDWQVPVKYVNYYQEDCTLLYEYELRAMKDYIDEVPCRITLSEKGNANIVVRLKKVHIDSYNIMLTFNSGITLAFPLSFVEDAIRHNNNMIKLVDDQRLIEERVKFLRHDGDSFKQKVNDRQIVEWQPSYCSVCGNPITFKFHDNEIEMENKCSCGCLVLNLPNMSYDQFAIWYASQVNDNVRKVYDKFWFEKR